MPVRPVNRTYPVYAPDKEPPGYWESPQQKDPEILFDPAKLKSREDGVGAGKLVFEQPTVFTPAAARLGAGRIRAFRRLHDGHRIVLDR